MLFSSVAGRWPSPNSRGMIRRSLLQEHITAPREQVELLGGQRDKHGAEINGFQGNPRSYWTCSRRSGVWFPTAVGVFLLPPFTKKTSGQVQNACTHVSLAAAAVLAIPLIPVAGESLRLASLGWLLGVLLHCGPRLGTFVVTRCATCKRGRVPAHDHRTHARPDRRHRHVLETGGGQPARQPVSPW